jgi:iron complex outermembrane receptor protein
MALRLLTSNAIRCAALAVSGLSFAGAAAIAQTQTVIITGHAPPAPTAVSGFDDTPPARAPFAATSISERQMQDAGTPGLRAITQLDAGVSDAYNAEGYWSLFSIRGFVIDPRFNYRRDGLPINAETSIALDNKQAVEILKGLSGMQAGTSAPGGLVNLVVKRPSGTIRQVSVEFRQRGTFGAAIDLGDRAGGDGQFGWRLNATAQRLDPQVRSARGERQLLALAGDWRLSADTLIEAEVEHSHQSQPSVPGFSLLDTQVPDARQIDPRINLNNQPWSQPVVMDGDTASLRFTQRLNADWRFKLHLATQRLRSDDRVAFPYGVYNPADYTCVICDRFAADGTFTLWQYISDNERRRTDALDASLGGRATLAGQVHQVQAGVLRSRYRARLGEQVNDIAGTGRIDGSAVTPPSARFAIANTNRDEDTTELYARDQWHIGAATSAWLGLRRTQLARSSIGTDGSEPTDYERTFTTPWLALTHQLTEQDLAYMSWGQGVESEIVPNRAIYIDAGQALPAFKSRQLEAGFKHDDQALDWSLIAFDIRRPMWSDFGACNADASCTRARDGAQRHRGIEAAAGWRTGPWALRLTALGLQAKREDSVDGVNDGRRPTNVPARSIKAQAQYDLAALPGLTLLAALTSESARIALPDNSAQTPGWTQVDLGARYTTTARGKIVVWRLGLDNAADTRAWRESPYQFNHAYLFPLVPRSWWLTLHTNL